MAKRAGMESLQDRGSGRVGGGSILKGGEIWLRQVWQSGGDRGDREESISGGGDIRESQVRKGGEIGESQVWKSGYNKVNRINQASQIYQIN